METLEKLYLLHLSEQASREANCFVNGREEELRRSLYELLPKDKQRLLEEWNVLLCERYEKKGEVAYYQGFQDGAKLMTEVFTARFDQ